MTLKIHTKGEGALRIEVIAHKTRAYRWERPLACFPEIATRLKAIPERFPNALGWMDSRFVSDETQEQLPHPATLGQTKVSGIDLNGPVCGVAEAVPALSPSGPSHGWATGRPTGHDCLGRPREKVIACRHVLGAAHCRNIGSFEPNSACAYSFHGSCPNCSRPFARKLNPRSASFGVGSRLNTRR